MVTFKHRKKRAFPPADSIRSCDYVFIRTITYKWFCPWWDPEECMFACFLPYHKIVRCWTEPICEWIEMLENQFRWRRIKKNKNWIIQAMSKIEFHSFFIRHFTERKKNWNLIYSFENSNNVYTHTHKHRCLVFRFSFVLFKCIYIHYICYWFPDI